jgi:uncharacterized protein (DUF111 family)
VLGQSISESVQTSGGHPLVILEANIDDATGETLAHAIETLMDAGALDAWLAPVVMKKGRPGHVLSVLADPTLADELSLVMRSETGTLGVRSARTERWAAARSYDEVEVAGLSVRIKVSPGRAKAEYRDAVKVAGQTGLPLREVVSIAEAAWRGREGDVRPHDQGDDPAPA